MAIFYYKNYFSNIKSKEARLRGALVSYEGLTNSIRAFFRAPEWKESFDNTTHERMLEVVRCRPLFDPAATP